MSAHKTDQYKKKAFNMHADLTDFKIQLLPPPQHTHDLTLNKIKLPFKIQLQYHHESG